jgi:membrane-bound metal-dependent hydrolase YbcI (DUF457 family)
MIWQILREQQEGRQGIIVPCFHHATNGWFTIGSMRGLVGFDEAESCFLAISKGDLRIEELLNLLLPLFTAIIFHYKPSEYPQNTRLNRIHVEPQKSLNSWNVEFNSQNGRTSSL